MGHRIAIVGRPNVGKSTLFNRLVGARRALVDDRPGITRDRQEGEGRLFDLSFTAIDTAGLEDADPRSLEGRMRAQTETAVREADLALLIIDARAGVTPIDRHFADWARQQQKPVILVANKAEGRAGESGVLEAYELGFGEPVAFSAEHGLGLGDLHEAISIELGLHEARTEEAAPDGDEVEAAEEYVDEEPGGPVRLAIVGRPNVGKSTLVNRLLGQERMLVGPEAGITRDAVSLDWEYQGRRLTLVDTAGLRRRSRVVDRVEKMSVQDTLHTVRFAQVVVLVVDAAEAMERQDLTIARMVIEEGRALVIAVNKWDACDDRRAVMRALRQRLERSLPQVRGVAVVPLSALTGQNMGRLMKAVFGAADTWNRRVGTSRLNKWLEEVIDEHPPPAVSGRRIRMKYMTQPKSRPPTFTIFCSKPEGVPDSYLRYLENQLRESFNLEGTPIRIHLKKGDNPYA